MAAENTLHGSKYIVNNRGSIAKHLEAGSNWIEMTSGSHLRVLAAEGKLVEGLIATRVGDDLVVLYDDGTNIVFRGYFNCEISADEETPESCSVTLAGDKEPYVVPAGAGYQSGNAQVIYHHARNGASQPSNQELVKSLSKPQQQTDEIVASSQKGDVTDVNLTNVEPAIGPGIGILPGLAGGGLLIGAAAGGGGSSSPSPSPSPITTKLAGSIILGPLVADHGVSVHAYAKDGTLLGTARATQDGRYELTLNQVYTGYVLLKAVDGNAEEDYLDEASRQRVDMSMDLRAVVAVKAGETVIANITPVTELAVLVLHLKAGDAGDSEHTLSPFTDAHLAAINAQIAAALGLANVNVVADTPVALVDVNGDLVANANVYGHILAAMSGMEQNASLTTAEMLQQLAEALSGEQLSNSLKSELMAGSISAGANTTHLGLSLGVDNAEAMAASLQTIASMNTDNSQQLSLEDVQSLSFDSINSAARLDLFNQVIQGLPNDQTNSLAELGNLAAVLVKVQSGVQAGQTALSTKDFQAIGISGVDTAFELQLMTEVLDAKPVADKSDLTAIQTYANAIDGIDIRNISDLTQLQAIGVGAELITQENIAIFNHLLQGQADDAVDSLSELNNLAGTTSVLVASINSIVQASQTNAANVIESTYSNAGISGVTSGHLGILNSFWSLNEYPAPISASEGENLVLLQQAWIQEYASLWGNIYDLQSNTLNAQAIQSNDLGKLGFSGADANHVSLFNDILKKQASLGDTAADILGVVAAVKKLSELANGTDNLTLESALTLSEFGTLGMASVNSQNVADFVNKVLNNKPFVDVDSWSELQMIDQAVANWLSTTTGINDPLTLANVQLLGFGNVRNSAGEDKDLNGDHLSVVRRVIDENLDDVATFNYSEALYNAAFELEQDLYSISTVAGAMKPSEQQFAAFLQDINLYQSTSNLTTMLDILAFSAVEPSRIDSWNEIQAFIIAIDTPDNSSFLGAEAVNDSRNLAELMLFADALSLQSGSQMFNADTQSNLLTSALKAIDLIDDDAGKDPLLTLQDLHNLGISDATDNDVQDYNTAMTGRAFTADGVWDWQWNQLDSVAEMHAII